MVWKTVTAAQSNDAKSLNIFRKFANINSSHKNSNSSILYNSTDGTYRLVNNNGIFYSNGRFFSKYGAKGNYDTNTGNFLRKKTEPVVINQDTPKIQKAQDVVSLVTNSAYLSNYIGKTPNVNNTLLETLNKITSNSGNGFRTAWINARNSGLGTFTWKGLSYNTRRKGESKLQYNTWLSKLSKQAQLSKPVLGTPGYGIHVGNNGVTLLTPNGLTTDITNSHNVSTLINNGNYKAPNLGILSTNLLDTTPLSNYLELSKHNFNRADIRLGMRDNGFNPYSYSGSDRKLLRTYLNNPTTDNYTQSVSKIVGDGKVLLNMLNNAVLNLTDKYQLTKPLLVNLKFKQGGQMYKYQQGGLASGQQGMELQAIALVLAAMQGDLLANLTIQLIMLAAQLGDLQALQVALLLQAIILKMKGSRKARLGAKLNYIRQSIGECPEGQEVVYFKKGGEICKVCQGKKMQNGGKLDAVSAFKKKKELDKVKESQQRNSYTRGRSAKEIAEMQKKNRQEASLGKGESPANVAPWRYKKK